MVARCKSPASAMRETKRAWRSGGGGSAGGSSKVSSMLNVRVPATISIRPKHLLRVAGIFPILPADEAALPPAFAPTPAFDGIRRSRPRPAAGQFEKRTKIEHDR